MSVCVTVCEREQRERFSISAGTTSVPPPLSVS